jgi:hypothetical protein
MKTMMKLINNINSVHYRIRTDTLFKELDFKSSASTIPPNEDVDKWNRTIAASFSNSYSTIKLYRT